MKPFRFIGAAFCGAGWGVARKARILPRELGGKVKSVCHCLRQRANSSWFPLKTLMSTSP